MHLRLYDQLVDFYHLIDPVEDHALEAAVYAAALKDAVSGHAKTLLELGCGAGNNASFLKRSFQCTLTDLSPRMLELSRQKNPECSHQLGDMRSLRCDEQFDCVFVHDAICYMTSVDDLRAMAETAFVHTRPGGAAVFAPDSVRETFGEHCETYTGDDGERTLHCLEWSWDPDPDDTTCQVDYALMLRHRGQVSVVHDQHVEGLFATATWREVLEAAGFEVDTAPRQLAGVATPELYYDALFVGRRPE